MNYTTLVVMVSVCMLFSMFAAVMALLAARHSRFNSILLKTNSGKTIGRHIEEFQEDQIVLRDELMSIARAKLKADALLTAASLEAIATLTAASNVKKIEVAKESAEALIYKADETAHTMTTLDEDVDPELTATELIAKAKATAHILTQI